MLQALQLELSCKYLWKDFPHGLHVLLVDRDPRLLLSVKSRLEEWKYTVTTFERCEDAVAALENPDNLFHVALVEATAGMGLDRFSILNAKNRIPTIKNQSIIYTLLDLYVTVMSDTDNTNIMLEAIAMGAAEVLQKPLSDEKLKNIWQHVVRKAISAGKMPVPHLAIPSQVDSPSSNLDNNASNDTVCLRKEEDEGFVRKGKPNLTVDVTGCEKFSAPSTPQQEPGGIRLTDVRSEDNIDESSGNSETTLINVKNEVEEMQQLIESETVSSEESGNSSRQCTFKREVDSGTNDGALDFYMNCDKIEFDSSLHDFCMSMEGELLSDLDMDPEMLADFSVNDNEELDMSLYALDDCEILETDLAEEEALLLAEVSKAEKQQMTVPNTPKSTRDTSSVGISDISVKGGESSSSEKKLSKGDGSGKASSKNSQAKRKVKVDWTPDLHRRFVQAVEQLGVDKAVPSRILELMGVNCLNRHNIASHLQKYRSHRKHLLAREAEAATWNQKRQIYAAPGTRTARELTPWVAHNGNPPIQPRPSIGFPPISPAPQTPSYRSLHVWGHPTVDHSVAHMWQKQPVTPPTLWSAADGSFWQHPAPTSADTWAHKAPAPGTPCIYPQPLVRFPMAPVPGVPHFIPPVFSGSHYRPEGSSTLYTLNSEVPEHLKSSNIHPSKEAVDATISEVLANPWAPLPIGLKAPSLESVMNELQRQGIPTVPPASA